jgi:benzoate-CoA ligase
MAERPTPEATFLRWQGQGAAQRGLKPTAFFGAPTGFAGMLAHPKLPARGAVALRLVSSAGEALPAELGERFRQHFGVDIVDGIGSTEMLHIFLSNRPERVRYGTTGWPVPGYQVELRGEGGGAVPDGEPGDLFIHGPSAAMMYWGNRAKTRDTFQGGWTKSGDKYVRNADGSYTYSGRSDDMLKVSGIYVSPFEVEATLVQHPAVLEAAVIGKEDDEGLVKTKAFVVLKPGASVDEAELKVFVKERLAPYKYPRFIEFVASAKGLQSKRGISAMDIAKRLLDYGFHAPTVYFPLVVQEAMMIEPTETESKETLDAYVDAIHAILAEDPEHVHAAPHTTPVSRPDDVKAARNPILKATVGG